MPARAINPDWIVRPAAAGDLEALLLLAESLGSGMTTVPRDKSKLAHKIACSEATFAGQACDEAQYVLVLEDGGSLLGISALYPRVGDRDGFFSYKLTKLVQRSALLNRRSDVELLTLSNEYTGATEVGSLAVAPILRGTGAGRLLARARYMLIAAFPQLFSEIIFAELRGWQDENGHSPFWDAIGAHFFGISFAEADRLSAMEGVKFIAELMPKHPIYTALLPPPARAAIGKPHRDSLKAMNMLLEEDFHYEGLVDVFDGGPQIHAARDKIRTVTQNRALGLGKTQGGAPVRLLLANGDLARFRVAETLASVDDGAAALSDGVRRALGLTGGDLVHAAPGRKLRATTSA